MAVYELLLEDGASLLLEDGAKLLLEFPGEETNLNPSDFGDVLLKLSGYYGRTVDREFQERVMSRLEMYTTRIWSFSVNQAVRTIYSGVNDSKTFGFDFSLEGSVKDGATLSSPSVPAVSGLTIGTPSVLSTDFNDGGANKRKIAAGKGVKVRISGTPGSYDLVCLVTSSDGDLLSIPGKLIITDN